MPLQDHFRPPLSLRRHWHSFHNAWATYICSDLIRVLPEGYFAEANVQFNIEIDVAALEDPAHAPPPPGWSPPPPARTVSITLLTDVVEIQVFGASGGPTLAAAIELVSPSNKDRPASRDAFVSKCASYLQQGIGLVVVDVVTTNRANLHAELLTRLAAPNPREFDADLYATAYRPIQRNGDTGVELWQEALAVGGPLPTLPLWLRGGPCLEVDLEASYERTRREQGWPSNGA